MLLAEQVVELRIQREVVRRHKASVRIQLCIAEVEIAIWQKQRVIAVDV